MKINLKRDPQSLELIKLAGSKNREVSKQAMEILAGFITPIIQTVIYKASVADGIYTKLTYDQDTSPSIPLDLYIDKKVDFVRVWSQSIAGGLPSNLIQGLTEMKISTYELNSAVSFLKRYARLGQLDHVGQAIKWMAQEILVKREINAFTPILAALAGATTNGLSHIINSTTAGVLQIDDFNRLWTRARKINAASIDGGTPVAGGAKGITDLFLSPEMMEQVRAFAYQPMNTRIGVQTVIGTPANAYGGATAVPLPDSVREEIYRNAGASEIFGLTLHDINELSPEGPYGVIFDQYYGGTFTAGTSNLVIGLDLGRTSLIEAVETDENGNELVVLADDQWVSRSEKIGWYANRNQGHVVLDDRVAVGLIV